MDRLVAKTLKVFTRRHEWRRKTNLAIIDPEHGIYVQECFLELLSLERKRAERSKEPFLLMLVDVEKIPRDETVGGATKVIAQVLSSSIRETDSCGWFRQESVFGAIFTGIDEVGPAMETIAAKIRKNLLDTLPEGTVRHVTISIQAFPENHDSQKASNPFNLLFYPDIVKKDPSEKVGALLKRVLDIAGSVFALILFSPLFLTISILIRLSSPGPVLFRQERIGQYGKKFVFYKFRSMYVNNDDSIHREYIRKFMTELNGSQAAAGAVYKLRKDPRITPIGEFLRKTSLDELPQFFNVLKGEMSLVGPRPPIPYELENYDIWHMHRVLGVKPGITGLWQVKGRSLTTFDGMVRLDLQYIRDWSLWLDVKLLLQTPLAVVKGKGAY